MRTQLEGPGYEPGRGSSQEIAYDNTLTDVNFQKCEKENFVVYKPFSLGYFVIVTQSTIMATFMVLTHTHFYVLFA